MYTFKQSNNTKNFPRGSFWTLKMELQKSTNTISLISSKAASRAEKRRDSSSSLATAEKRQVIERINTPSIPEIRPPSINPQPSLTNSNISPAPVSSMSNSVVPVNYNLGHISGAGGNAIVAAASQAIAATQHMQQGRRTASLKASYEAINTGGGIHASEISRELAGAAQSAIAAIQESNKKNKNKYVKKRNLKENRSPYKRKR